MRDKKDRREQMPRKWRGNEGEEDRNCDGECIKSEGIMAKHYR